MFKTFISAACALAIMLIGSMTATAGFNPPRSTTPFQWSRPHAAMNGGFNQPGNIIIADQFNNRIIEIDNTHRIAWSFGSNNPALCNPGPGAIIAPNDEERVGDFTLMAGTGVPPSTIPQMPKGCADNRVIAVDESGRIAWQYGKAGVGGAGFNELNTPVCDVFLPNFHVLITDQANERVIEVTLDKRPVWQYGMTGVTGSGFNQLNNPNCAELLPNGHILIADENNNRVIEVTRSKHIVWQYGDPSNPAIVNGAAFASRLPNGNTLITDSGNSRILEVDDHKRLVWAYVTNARKGSISAPLPTRAVRLRNGLTLISDQFNHQVIAVNRAGGIVFAQGIVGKPGNTFNHLYGPYDAKVVGDYTGLTPPFSGDDNGNHARRFRP
ncbi:MAG: hypothetical protein M3Z41_10925 [Candidatus Eremiobacteraeota bacterium]|nr:hypothetical protein [Candidatus Eremiobacteraeota bacterium]